MYKFKLTKLNNGLRILMVPSKESLSFQFTVSVNTGADFETKRTNGISHFLEHMCFKGTKKRPTNLDITKELDSVGGYYNALTDKEYTGYYARLAKENKELAIDIVSDIYLNSLFPENEIQKEKGVLIEEINTYRDTPPEHVVELWDQLLYGDQPAGWPIVGLKDNIQKMKRIDFLKYHQAQYKSRSTLLVASGNFNSQQLIALLKKYFQTIPVGQGKAKQKMKERQRKPEILLEYRKTDQTHLVLGVRGINLFDKRRYALAVLGTVFDGGMSARLFQLVREKLGAAYYVYSNVLKYTDRGYWSINAGIDNDRLEKVLLAILKEWSKLKTEVINLKEIKKAKDNIRGRVALAIEDVHSLAYIYAKQLLLEDKIETPEQYLKKIKQVTSRDLQKVAQDLLKPQSLNLTLIGPHKNKEKLQKLLSNF